MYTCDHFHYALYNHANLVDTIFAVTQLNCTLENFPLYCNNMITLMLYHAYIHNCLGWSWTWRALCHIWSAIDHMSITWHCSPIPCVGGHGPHSLPVRRPSAWPRPSSHPTSAELSTFYPLCHSNTRWKQYPVLTATCTRRIMDNPVKCCTSSLMKMFSYGFADISKWLWECSDMLQWSWQPSILHTFTTFCHRSKVSPRSLSLSLTSYDILFS